MTRSKNSRYSELKKIHPLGGIDHRLLINEKGQLPQIAGLPRNERRRIKAESKKLAAQYHGILRELATSGAGFPTDQILRHMAVEYTHRYASSGIYNQPTSFNSFEPFCHIRVLKEGVAPYMELAPEVDHLFSSTDFFDYLTSSESDSFQLEFLYNLPEEKTFHFSINGSVKDISFLNAEGREFLLSGFSMIRRGDSLHWYLIGGELFSQDEWDIKCLNPVAIDIEKISPSKRAFLSQAIKDTGGSQGAPLPLEGTKTARRTIIAGEMDILTKKHLSRCYMMEYEHSFVTFCDDPDVLYEINDKDTFVETINNMMRLINEASVMWNLAEGLIQLPHYFSSKIFLEKEVLLKSGKRLTQKKGGKGLEARYKVVPSIEVVESVASNPIKSVSIAHYETETQGYWKRLELGEVGQDRNGKPTNGRTWVQAERKWDVPNSDNKVIFVKDTLSSAKLKIAEYKYAAEKTLNDTRPCDETKGELYVMRCAAMMEKVFKVGFTTGSSQSRAEQLSAATGVPLSFVVVKAWSHEKASELETDIHMMLAPYQINDSREFFEVDFETIEEIVEQVLKRQSV